MNAYAPYSGYLVGAALEDEEGRIFAGVNVENVSYGACICAERSAVTRMVTEGGRSARALALVTVDGGVPCGICLQVLTELCEDAASFRIIIADEEETIREHKLSELLPYAFESQKVQRT